MNDDQIKQLASELATQKKAFEEKDEKISEISKERAGLDVKVKQLEDILERWQVAAQEKDRLATNLRKERDSLSKRLADMKVL